MAIVFVTRLMPFVSFRCGELPPVSAFIILAVRGRHAGRNNCLRASCWRIWGGVDIG